MPVIFGILGIILIVTAVRGTTSQVGTLLRNDFAGPGNFLYWVAAILIIGAVGYVPKLRGFSQSLIGLVFVTLLLSNRGFFAQLENALNTGTTTANANSDNAVAAAANAASSSTTNQASSGSSDGSAVGSAIGTALPLLLSL